MWQTQVTVRTQADQTQERNDCEDTSNVSESDRPSKQRRIDESDKSTDHHEHTLAVRPGRTNKRESEDGQKDCTHLEVIQDIKRLRKVHTDDCTGDE